MSLVVSDEDLDLAKKRVLDHVTEKWKGKSGREDWMRTLQNINKAYFSLSLSLCLIVGSLRRLFPHSNKMAASDARWYIPFKLALPAEQNPCITGSGWAAPMSHGQPLWARSV